MEVLLALVFVAVLFCGIFCIVLGPNGTCMLKNIPGISVLSLVRSVNNKNFIAKLDYLSRMHGPHMKLNIGIATILIISDADDSKSYLSHSSSLEKPQLFYADIKDVMGNGLLAANGKLWRHHRKLLSKLFRPSQLKSHIEAFQKAAEKLTASLSENVCRGSNFAPMLNKALIQANHKLLFGCDMQNEEGWTKFFNYGTRISEIISYRVFNPLLRISFIFHNFTTLGKELELLKKEGRNFIDEVCGSLRLQQELQGFCESTKSALSILSNSNCSKEEIRDEIITLAIASADTTKTAICLAFVLLGLHPMVQENLHEEVMRILGPTAPCDAKNVKKLQYAEMVVLETLRIFPVVPLYARQNPYDVKLKSYTVPANTIVLINNFTMHRHEKYWSDPLSFHPERFSPENTTNRKKNGYAPFAIGQRMCPGSKYAVTEAVIILANVIRDYKISADYKSVEDVPLAFNVGIYLSEEANIAFNKRM